MSVQWITEAVKKPVLTELVVTNVHVDLTGCWAPISTAAAVTQQLLSQIVTSNCIGSGADDCYT